MADLRTYGPWALVTGASAGLGAAFARRIASEGVHCLLVAEDGEGLSRIATEIREAYGVETRVVEQDLTEEGFLRPVEEAAHGLEVGLLVNNAGIGCGGHFVRRDPARIEALVRLNCLAPTLLARRFMPLMTARGRGGVIFVSSIMGLVSAPWEAAYSGSKAYLLRLAEALWHEQAAAGVDVLALCPAGVRTRFFERDGLTAAESDYLRRRSAAPEAVVNLAFRKLGATPFAAPFQSRLADVLVRLCPRALSIRVASAVARQFMDPERL
jgi:hypothetical protein